MPANNGDGMTRAFRAVPGFVARAMQENRKKAILGWQKSSTEIVLDAPGGLGELYITWSEKGTRDTARRRANIPLARRMPVLIERIAEVNYIVDIDWSDPRAVLAVLNNNFGVFPHPFTSHTDVPSSYATHAGKVVKVNVGETALEFATEAGALVTSVNTQTGAVVLNADHIDDAATTNKFATAAELTKLAGIETAADVTDAANVGSSIDGTADLGAPADTDKLAAVRGGSLGTILVSALKTAFNALYVGLTGNQTVAGNKTWSNTAIFNGASTVFNGLIGVKVTPTRSVQILDSPAQFHAETNIASSFANVQVVNDAGSTFEFSAWGSAASGTTMGEARAGKGLFRWSGATLFGIGTSGAAPLGFITNSLRRMTITEDGNVGILTTAPQGPLHIHDGTGGSLFVTKTGVNGTAQTIIANGTGDVLRHCFITGVLWATDGSMSRGFTIQFANNASTEVDVDAPTNANGVTFAVSSAGALTIQRTTGSKTYTFAGHIVWL